jgi:tetratricopeptide (TPR) repeat protein
LIRSLTAKRRFLLVAAVGLAVLPVRALHAQAPGSLQGDVRTDLASALRVIRPLLRDDPNRAITMLEKLDKEYPGNPQVLMLLGDTYQAVGDTEAAKTAYESCLRASPADIQAGSALGVLYMKTDQRDKADAVFRGLLDKTKQNLGTYRSIGMALSRAGFYDLALLYYKEGRERNNDSYVLTIDIAYLLRSVGDLEGALREYVDLMADPRQTQLARTRILELLLSNDADQEKLLDLLKTQGERPGPQQKEVLGILASAYLDRGQLESALDAALRAEQLGGSDGTVLFSLADRSVTEYRQKPERDRSEYFGLALRALDAYLKGYPKGPQVPRAKLMLSELLVDYSLGCVKGLANMSLDAAASQALDALDWLIATYPNTEYAEQAYLKKGDLTLRVKKDPNGARAVYQEGLNHARTYRATFAERLGQVYLVLDQYDEARRLFTSLLGSAVPEQVEGGQYYTGLLLAFEHEYEAARDTLTALAEGNPASPYTNDAIKLGWSIEEGLQGDQKVLGAYFDAVHAELSSDTATAVQALKVVAGSPKSTALRPRGLIALGDNYAASGRYDEAVAVYEQFLSDYPKNTLVPEVERKIGGVYENGYHKIDVALEKYEDILISYPHYLFLDEVRDDVNRLKGILGKK